MSERGVTQPGRVPVLGTGRRMFESCRPDPENIQKAASLLVRLSCFCIRCSITIIYRFGSINAGTGSTPCGSIIYGFAEVRALASLKATVGVRPVSM